MNFTEHLFWPLEAGLWDCGSSTVEVCHAINLSIGSWTDRSNKKLVEDLKTPLPGSQDLYFPTQFPQSYPKQLQTILWKMNITYWRSPDYNLVRFIFTLFMALIFGTLFYQVGMKR